MDELQKQMALDAEAEALTMPSDAALVRVATLTAKQADLEKQVQKKESELKQLKGDLARVTELELPEALDAVGVASLTLTDGSKVEVNTDYFANISEERRAAAFQWLRDHGHDDLIKRSVSCTFGRGEGTQAEDLMVLLDEQGLPYESVEGIHPQTLKAFVKEQLGQEVTLTPEEIAAGMALPRATFGVFKKRVAKVVPAKKKKVKG